MPFSRLFLLLLFFLFFFLIFPLLGFANSTFLPITTQLYDTDPTATLAHQGVAFYIAYPHPGCYFYPYSHTWDAKEAFRQYGSNHVAFHAPVQGLGFAPVWNWCSLLIVSQQPL